MKKKILIAVALVIFVCAVIATIIVATRFCGIDKPKNNQVIVDIPSTIEGNNPSGASVESNHEEEKETVSVGENEENNNLNPDENGHNEIIEDNADEGELPLMVPSQNEEEIDILSEIKESVEMSGNADNENDKIVITDDGTIELPFVPAE